MFFESTLRDTVDRLHDDGRGREARRQQTKPVVAGGPEELFINARTLGGPLLKLQLRMYYAMA